LQTSLSDEGSPSVVRLIGESLQNVVQFMRSQDVFISNDTGLPHLVATAPVEDMPQVVTLFAAPDADPNLWVTSPNMKPVVPPKNATTDRRGGIYCMDPDIKWINAIDPKVVAGNALASMAA
jgi:ADP-heptose:LPS heptosyltransferase